MTRFLRLRFVCSDVTRKLQTLRTAVTCKSVLAILSESLWTAGDLKHSIRILCVCVSERVGLTVHMDVERSYLFPFCSLALSRLLRFLSARRASSVQTLQSAPNSSRPRTAGSIQAPQIFLFRVSPALNIVIRSASARLLLSLFVTVMYQGQILF